MKEVVKIMQDVIDSIDNTIFGTIDASTGAILTCKTKWMRIGKSVFNADGDEYKVLTLVRDEQFTAEAVNLNSPPLEGTIYLQSPFWISGTHMATNNEWTKVTPNLLQKTPIAWLLETIRLVKYGYGDTRDFETEVRMFFLDETDIVNYYTADHREQVVLPMSELAIEFIETLKSNRKFKLIDQYQMLTFSRFGIERSDGMFQNILDANLSGVEVQVSVTKYKENCKC